MLKNLTLPIRDAVTPMQRLRAIGNIKIKGLSGFLYWLTRKPSYF